MYSMQASLLLVLFAAAASPIANRACSCPIFHFRTHSLNQPKKFHNCFCCTDKFTAPQLTWQNDSSLEHLYCDGGPFALHWRFRDDSLNAKQQSKLSCTKRNQCRLTVSPLHVDRAGKYSCCVSRCGRFICSSKTIRLQNLVVVVPNTFMIGAQVNVDIELPSNLPDNMTVQIDLVTTSYKWVYTMAKNVSLMRHIVLNITELPLQVEITDNYRVRLCSSDDKHEGYSNEFHFTFTGIKVDTPVYKNGSIMNTSTIHTGHTYWLAFDYNHSNVFMKGVSLYLVTVEYGVNVEHIGTFNAVADRRPAVNLWSPYNHSGSFYIIAQDNGSTLATGGSQMLEILPDTDNNLPLFYQRASMQYVIVITSLLFTALALLIISKLKYKYSNPHLQQADWQKSTAAVTKLQRDMIT